VFAVKARDVRLQEAATSMVMHLISWSCETPLTVQPPNGLFTATERHYSGSIGIRGQTSRQRKTSHDEPGVGVACAARRRSRSRRTGGPQRVVSPLFGRGQSPIEKGSREGSDPNNLRKGRYCRRFDSLTFRGLSGSTFSRGSRNARSRSTIFTICSAGCGRDRRLLMVIGIKTSARSFFAAPANFQKPSWQEAWRLLVLG